MTYIYNCAEEMENGNIVISKHVGGKRYIIIVIIIHFYCNVIYTTCVINDYY